VRTDAFDYPLPDHAIAQVPAEPRDASRLLVDRGPGREPDHRLTRDLPELLGPGDLLVLNETRVLAARLRLHKPTGGAVEVLALEPYGAAEDGWWAALVRPSRRVVPGTVLADGTGAAAVEVGGVAARDQRLVRAVGGRSMEELLVAAGEVPLPPYITARLADPERYQTTFARRASSVAAPTAGLHLTPAVLARCEAAGARVATVDLSVGLGTFRPISAETVEGHGMHEERYHVPAATWEACQQAARVVAVGTTVVRTLESAAAAGDLAGRTGLYITPGYRFAVVDALLTNFHLPRSSLLVLVQAFMGPGWRDLYATALVEGYRFLSFGDAMFVDRARRLHPVETRQPAQDWDTR
jgi:S-adenosylmethionine:tRNA ribosyltransferase-isomerase